MPDITLIFPSSPFLLNDHMFPPLGIMYLSAFLKRYKLKAQCLDLSLPQHSKEMASSDVIGISFSTPQRDEAFKLVKYYKEKGKYLIAGGPHPSHMPEECFKVGFDRVVRGNGEAELLWILTEKKEDNRRSVDLDVDLYPFPDRECLPIQDYYQEIDGRPATVLIASRGCPYRCSFCANIDQKFRMQSAERTLVEIDFINQRYGYTAFTLYDDTFTVSKSRLKEMADALEKKDYRFRCFSRANLLDDDTCQDLARMGVTAIGIGVESGSDEILKINIKGTGRDMNTRAIENLHKVGIQAKAFLIVGLPGETEKTIKETARWIEEAKPDDIAVSVFQPLPGSSIFKNPDKWGVNFKYNGQPMWYRGIPGDYKPTVETKELSTDRIVYLRDWLENTYKDPASLK